MANVEISQAVITLAATALGGFLVLGTQRYMHNLASAAARKKQREERLEAIVKLIFEFSKWLDRDVKHRIVDDIMNNEADYLSDACALQELYFPELSGEMFEFKETSFQHSAMFSDFFSGIQKLSPPPAKHQRYGHWDHDQYIAKVYRPNLVARAALIKKCRQLIEADEVPIARRWYERFQSLAVIKRLSKEISP